MRGRYRSKHALPPRALPVLTALERLGVSVTWLAHLIGRSRWALYYRLNGHKKSSLPLKKNC